MNGVDPSQNHPETTDTPQVLLEHHLKALRLPTILREYDKVAQQCAADSVDYPRFLLRITELELPDLGIHNHRVNRFGDGYEWNFDV